MRIGELGEAGIIHRITSCLAGVAPGRLVRGPGDDAAVLRPPAGASLVWTSDLLVEGTHFRREWMPSRLLGHKSLAVNLSDLAAMGADPLAFLLDLVLPADWPVVELDAFGLGLARLARRTGIPLAGGDTCAGRALHVGITALGSVPAGPGLGRHGGRAGDRLVVTGSLGGAAAGLALLESGWRLGDDGTAFPPAGGAGGVDRGAARAVLLAQLAPEPELAAGRRLAQVARAALDLSDGLARDLPRLCAASECGAVVEAGEVPVDPAAEQVCRALGRDPLAAALAGGEDYRLLAVLAPDEESPVGVHAIGTLTGEGSGLRLRRGDREEPFPAAGYDPFSGT